MRQFIKFTEELSGFLMFLRLIYFMIKYVEVKINFFIHYRSNYIYTRMTNFQYYIFLKEKFNKKDREVVVWKSMSLGAMIINFFSLINVPASIMFSTYPYDFLFLPVIWISQQLLSLLQHLWNSNGLHLLKRTITKNNYTHQHTSLTTYSNQW